MAHVHFARRFCRRTGPKPRAPSRPSRYRAARSGLRLAHYEHEPIELEGGTTFYFISDSFDAAFGRASEAAGDRRVDIAGGASSVRPALAAGVIDELVLDFVPVLLGSGERLFDGVTDPHLEPVGVIHAPLATHMRYRVDR